MYTESVAKLFVTATVQPKLFGQSLTLESGINVGVRLIILGLFSRGYVLIRGATFINFWIFYSFLFIFFTFFPFAMYKNFKLPVILWGLCLFKGLCLLFLPNVPGATFIPDWQFIVHNLTHRKLYSSLYLTQRNLFICT